MLFLRTLARHGDSVFEIAAAIHRIRPSPAVRMARSIPHCTHA